MLKYLQKIYNKLIGVLSVQLTGSNEQVVYTSSPIEGSLAPGQTETVSFFAPSGYMSEIQGLGASVNSVPSSTTGTHVFEIGLGSTGASASAYTVSGAYNAVCSAGIAVLAGTFKGVKIDEDTGITIKYTNNTDQPQTVIRNYRITTFNRKKVV